MHPRPFHHARDSQAVMMNAVWMSSPCAQIRGEIRVVNIGLAAICVQCIFLVPEIGVRDQAPWKATYVSELCK